MNPTGLNWDNALWCLYIIIQLYDGICYDSLNLMLQIIMSMNTNTKTMNKIYQNPVVKLYMGDKMNEMNYVTCLFHDIKFNCGCVQCFSKNKVWYNADCIIRQIRHNIKWDLSTGPNMGKWLFKLVNIDFFAMVTSKYLYYNNYTLYGLLIHEEILTKL